MNSNTKQPRVLVVGWEPTTSCAMAAQQRPDSLAVTCPKTNEPVTLQRCSFCQHSEALLFDSGNDRLFLKCHF